VESRVCTVMEKTGGKERTQQARRSGEASPAGDRWLSRGLRSLETGPWDWSPAPKDSHKKWNEGWTAGQAAANSQHGSGQYSNRLGNCIEHFRASHLAGSQG